MTAAIENVSDQQHEPAAFYPGERPDTHFTAGLVGQGPDMDGWKISSPPGFELSPSSPYLSVLQLSYPALDMILKSFKF